MECISFRSDRCSVAQMTLRECAIQKLATALAPSPLYSGGEGWGEGRFSRAAQLYAPPLTLTLSPGYRGEGTGRSRACWRKIIFPLAV